MQQNWIVEHEFVSGDFGLEVRRYFWPRSQILVAETPTLNLTLAPSPVGETRPADSGSQAPFKKLGRLFFAPPVIPYAMRGPGGERRAISFRIDRDIFGRLTNGISWNEAQLAASADIRGTSIEATLITLAQEATSPNFASDVMLEAGGTTVAVRLARFLRDASTNHRQRTQKLSSRLLKEIDDLVRDDGRRSLKAIADHCGLSVRTLTRNFKATTGRTIVEMITEARIRRAMELLKDHSIPLKVVAFHAGFSSAASFTTAFRRETGFTPGYFRKYAASGFDADKYCSENLK